MPAAKTKQKKPNKVVREKTFEEAVARPPEPKLMMIPIDAIIEDETNHRLKSKDDEAKIMEMVPSVIAQGILQPIEVFRDLTKPNRYHRTFGARRTEAARRAGLKEIRAFVLGYTPTPAEREERRTIENFGRDDLNPAERAIAVSRMVEARGGTPAAIEATAAVLGIKRKEAQDYVYVVARLSTKVRTLLADGTITLGHARVLIKCKDHHQQESIADEMVVDARNGREIFSVEDIEGMVRDMQRPLEGVLWKLDVIVAGKPACVGCEHNTDSQTDLFGAKKGETRCTFGVCYDFKKNKTGEAGRLSVEKARDDLKTKKILATEVAAINYVRTVTPDYMDPTAIQSIIKSQITAPAIKKKNAGKASSASAPSAKAEPKKPLTEKQRRAEAVSKWNTAFLMWRENFGLKFGKLSQSDPRLNIVAWWLSEGRAMVAHPEFALKPGATDLPEEKPVAPSLAKLLTAAGEEKFNPLLLAGDITGCRQVSLHGAGPELVKRIAEVFGFDMNDPKSQPPELEDFLDDQKSKQLTPAQSFKAPDFCDAGKMVVATNGMTLLSQGPNADGVTIRLIAHNGNDCFWAPEALRPATPAEIFAYEKASKKTAAKSFSPETPSHGPYAIGEYVVVTASNAVGEVMGYVPRNRNTVNVKLVGGAIRPHFEAELRRATPDEIRTFENERKE